MRALGAYCRRYIFAAFLLYSGRMGWTWGEGRGARGVRDCSSTCTASPLTRPVQHASSRHRAGSSSGRTATAGKRISIKVSQASFVISWREISSWFYFVHEKRKHVSPKGTYESADCAGKCRKRPGSGTDATIVRSRSANEPLATAPPKLLKHSKRTGYIKHPETCRSSRPRVFQFPVFGEGGGG